MSHPLIALLTASVMCISVVVAEDTTKPAEDPVAAELKKAKESYKTAVKAAADKLVTAFEAEDNKAEKNTKLSAEQYGKLSKQLAEERKAFKSDPAKLPKSSVMNKAVIDFQKTTADVKTKCLEAFKKAADAYRGKDKVAMSSVLAEKEQFFKNAPVVQKGNVWSNPAAMGAGLVSRIEITEMKDESFVGEMAIADGRKYTIRGTDRGGKVTFTTDKVPSSSFSRTFTGEIDGRVLRAEWTGIGTANDKKSGKIELKLEK